MTGQTELLIIGVGPTGLAAALFLAERGHKARIIEKAETIPPFSKAFGVNVRTLDLLERTGVTARFLENGRRMRHLQLRRNGKQLATLQFANADDGYPFMCVQSQEDPRAGS